MEVSFYDGYVEAGFPSPANDYLVKRIDLNDIIIKHPLSTFIIGCNGYSMINAFIPPKARLVVDRSVQPENGNIVLASINGEWTVKYLQKNEHKCRLLPANPKYKPIEVTPEMNLVIWGVIIQILINPNDLKCMPL